MFLVKSRDAYEEILDLNCSYGSGEKASEK